VSGVAIELQNVVVVRRGRPVLDIKQLDVDAGQFVGVVGRNGAGKTTLLRVMAGLLVPNRGAVRHDGQAITALSSWRRTTARRRVAFVPQAAEYNADLPLTVREIVAMGCVGPAGLLRSIGASAKARVRDWVSRLDLDALADRTFRSLSGGEQQKVLLARAMVQEPGLLLLDEPGANLDVDWKERLAGWLDRVLAERPTTAVMVSHETGLLPACCQRVVLMDAGGLVRQGPPDEVLTSEVLATLYGCPIHVIDVAGRRHAVAVPSESC